MDFPMQNKYCFYNYQTICLVFLQLFKHSSTDSVCRWIKYIKFCTFNSLWPSDAIWHHIIWSSFVQDWVVAWWHQATTWTSVDLSSLRSCGNHLQAISQEMLKIYILDTGFKITNLRLQMHLSGANELTLSNKYKLLQDPSTFPGPISWLVEDRTCARFLLQDTESEPCHNYCAICGIYFSKIRMEKT